MKKLIILSAISISIMAGCKQKEPEPKVTLGYLTPYVYCPEQISGHVMSVSETNYWAVEDNGSYTKGDIITRKERDSIGWSNDFVAKFDSDGLMTSIDLLVYDNINRAWVMESSEGLWRKATWWYNDTARVYFNLKYDEKNHFSTAERLRVKDDLLLNTYTYVTDDRGNIISGEMMNQEGALITRYKFTFNAKNLVDEYLEKDGSDSITYNVRNYFGENGFYTKSEILSSMGEVKSFIEMNYTKYDENGNWLEAQVSRDGKVFGIVERVYVYY